MSIRYLAIELYRLEKKLDELQRRYKDADPAGKVELEIPIRQARAERDEIRARLEAKKDPPTYRTRFR